jgi:hypothetical protein
MRLEMSAKECGSTTAYLLVENGDFPEMGTYIPLAADHILIGRPTSSYTPDICLDSFLISRKHCCIERDKDGWKLSDLGSKHGTTLNGQAIAAHVGQAVKHGDRIGLASSVAVMRFMLLDDNEKTLEFEGIRPRDLSKAALQQPALQIDLEQMRLVIGDAAIALSAKEWLFLEFLYKRRNKFVSYAEISAAVWAERYAPDGNLPGVGVEEINVLTYRLRKKLGDYGKMVRTLRGRGFILDM